MNKHKPSEPDTIQPASPQADSTHKKKSNFGEMKLPPEQTERPVTQNKEMALALLYQPAHADKTAFRTAAKTNSTANASQISHDY